MILLRATYIKIELLFYNILMRRSFSVTKYVCVCVCVQYVISHSMRYLCHLKTSVLWRRMRCISHNKSRVYNDCSLRLRIHSALLSIRHRNNNENNKRVSWKGRCGL